MAPQSHLNRLAEAAVRSHPAFNSELPVIYEGEVLNDEPRHYFLVCFDCIAVLKRMLQVSVWLNEDGLAAAHAVYDRQQSSGSETILKSPSAMTRHWY